MKLGFRMAAVLAVAVLGVLCAPPAEAAGPPGKVVLTACHTPTMALQCAETTMKVTGHEINGLNRALEITADEPSDGNASHKYVVSWNNHGYIGSNAIVFQQGPVREAGYNGVTNEALLAIVRHRLQGFQSGPYSSRENALALTKIEEALHWLHHRTAEREARGVEGTSSV